MPKYQLSIGAIILSLLVLPAITHAAYNDVTLTTDAVISVGGYSLTVSGSSALVQSLEVNNADFSVTVATGSSMTVSSSDRKIFTVDGVTSAYVTKTCTDSASTLAITVPSGSEAVPTALITPTSSTCATASVGSTVSGSTGSVGGTPPTPVSTPNPTIVAGIPGCPAGVTCTPQTTTGAVTLSKDLSRGNEGADVTKLQAFLALDKAIYPEGIANGFFGPATERAVKRFQAKYGISQVGRVGPATRAKIAEVSAGTPATPQTVVPMAPSVTPTVGGTVFSKLLSKGSTGSDVTALQKLLNKSTETTIATKGPGSPGNENGVFGSLTEQAVQRFQVKYGISAPGQDGYGLVGPKTRAKLNELSK